jgi:Domain of unknown function (DUF6916)
MPDLEDLQLYHFTPLVKSTFHLATGDGEEGGESLEVELVEAGEMDTRQKLKEGQRHPFALVFRSPSEANLEQGSYRLTHPALGVQMMFLVPIEEDAEGRYYEAVFT